MPGRRRHPRYLLAEPLDGHLRVREEVAIERWVGQEIEVLSEAPCRVSERLTLEVPGNGQSKVEVTVAKCVATVTGNVIRHRVRLSIDPAPQSASQGRLAP